jgi:NAD(P)-dependent dehydrogenase (short-subunit alcohol dehydrogenase family)
MTKRTVLLTGASRGLGRTIALACAPFAAELVLAARTAGNLRPTVEEVKSVNPGCLVTAVGGDLSTYAGIDQLLKEIGPERLSRIDVLINNAGGGEPRPLAETPAEDILRTHFLNLTAPAILCSSVAGGMTKRGWGRIINISSISAQLPAETLAVYASAKAGLNVLTRCLSAEVARYGVTVNAVMPGFMLTDRGRNAVLKPLSAKNGISEADIIKRLELAAPLRKLTDVEEVAVLVKMLIEESSGFITGQVIGAAGGL